MKLLTKAIRTKLPLLYSTEEEKDPLVIVKFFHPRGSWTWYVTEFDGQDIFFGLVIGFESELGYFSLKELTEVRDSWGLGVERDLWFKPTRLSKIRAKYGLDQKGD